MTWGRLVALMTKHLGLGYQDREKREAARADAPSASRKAEACPDTTESSVSTPEEAKPDSIDVGWAAYEAGDEATALRTWYFSAVFGPGTVFAPNDTRLSEDRTDERAVEAEETMEVLIDALARDRPRPPLMDDIADDIIRRIEKVYGNYTDQFTIDYSDSNRLDYYERNLFELDEHLWRACAEDDSIYEIAVRRVVSEWDPAEDMVFSGGKTPSELRSGLLQYLLKDLDRSPPVLHPNAASALLGELDDEDEAHQWSPDFAITINENQGEGGGPEEHQAPTESPPTADDGRTADHRPVELRDGRIGPIPPPIRPPVLLLDFHWQAAWDVTDSSARTMILRLPDHDAVTALLEEARRRARAEVTTKWLTLLGDLNDRAVLSGWRAAQRVEVAEAERGVWASLASGKLEGRCSHGATSSNCPINGCPNQPPRVEPSVEIEDHTDILDGTFDQVEEDAVAEQLYLSGESESFDGCDHCGGEFQRDDDIALLDPLTREESDDWLTAVRLHVACVAPYEGL